MRLAIPSRRPSEVFSFDHGGIRFDGQVSFLLNGDPVEVFLDGGKVGSPVQSAARDSAVAVSIALQFGVPLSTLRGAMTRSDDGAAAGPLGQLLDMIGGSDVPRA